MLYIAVNAPNGDLEDTIPFCSRGCRHEYAAARDVGEDLFLNSDGGDSNEYCATCGVIAHAGTDYGDENDSCECQKDNFVVNRFLSEDGETCEHGNWIQLPASYLERQS